MTQERIVARLHDGLGNQLFIYAAGRAIAAARGAQLLIDVHSGFERDRKYGAISQLHHFGIRAEIAPRSLSFPPPFGRQIRDLEISLSKHLPLRHRFVLREQDYDAAVRGAPLRSLVRLEGYWQSPRYFSAIADDIRRELGVVSPLSQKTLDIADRISRTDSVCLHVRQLLGAHHAFDRKPPAHVPQLPFSYYERAVQRLVQKIPAPTFFCFADDFEWIRARWSFPYPVHFVDHNRSQDSAYEDLALMSRCRHFIAGNSTFSWWGAWLSDNRDKIVIAPANRGTVVWGSEADLFPKDWDVIVP